MRIFFFFLTVIFLSSSLFSQARLSELIKQFDDHISDKNMDSAIHVSSQLFQLGKMHLKNERISEAFLCFQTADNCLEDLRKHTSNYNDTVCDILDDIGWNYRNQGQYRSAIEVLLKSQKIRENTFTTDTIGLYTTYNRLRVIYDQLHEFENGQNYSKQAEKWIVKLEKSHPVELAQHYQNDAVRYIHLGQKKNVEKCLNNSKLIWEKLIQKEPDNDTLIKKLSNHLNIWAWYFSEFDSSIAIIDSLYNESIRLMRKAGGNYAGRLNKLAANYKRIGAYDKADSLLNLSISYYDSVNKNQFKLNRLDAILNLADLYLKWGKFEKSEEYFNALQEYEKLVGPSQNDYLKFEHSLARLYVKTGRAEKAYTIYNKNFDKKSTQISDNFQWLNDAEKEAYWKSESDFFNDLSWFANEVYQDNPEAVSLIYSAALLTKSKLLESKINIEEDNRRRDQISKELRYSRYKLEQLTANGFSIDKKPLFEKLQNECDSLDKELTLCWTPYANQKRNLQITWEDVYQSLHAEEAAIEFGRYKKYEDSAFQYFALIIRKDLKLPILVPLCSEEEITSNIVNNSFDALYTLVWKPLEAHLKGSRRVYYSPVGELNNVAFNALCFGEKKELIYDDSSSVRNIITLEAKNDFECTYLMDRYELHQLTSTRYLALGLRKKEKERPLPSIVLIGGVNYNYLPGHKNKITENYDKSISRGYKFDSEIMSYLKGTKREVKSIDKRMNKNRWMTYVMEGNEATEDALIKFEKKDSKGILHIATHGYAFPEAPILDQDIKDIWRYPHIFSKNPMVRSGLILAGGNWAWQGSDTLIEMGAERNGILTALEVSNLDLSNTKLVVLSACETGLGKIEGSEGTFGLKRGFKLAGVEQMIVSLWSVPDKETMELMTLFYEDLSQSLNPVISFEKAQKQMRETYPKRPDLWAGFVLVR